MSKKFSLNKEDLKSIGTGLLVALGGALLTYVAENIGDIDFGVYSPFVVAIAAVLVNAGRKYLTGR